jgi:murein DD-endopeptidase MepM/ murein hydrolase activator NlpD
MPVSAIQAAGISVGTKVKAGQKIGEIGDCGNSQGAHLHFSVNPGDATDPKITSIASNNNGETYIDPAAYMLLYGVDIMGKRYTDGR